MSDERGAASLAVVTMAAVLMLVAVAATMVVALVRTHRIAQSAADLAALAGAAAAQQGGDGCAAAAEVASANGGRLLGCTSVRAGTQVQVGVDATGWQGFRFELRARARAGPVSADVAPSAGTGGRRPAPRGCC